MTTEFKAPVHCMHAQVHVLPQVCNNLCSSFHCLCVYLVYVADTVHSFVLYSSFLGSLVTHIFLHLDTIRA